MGITKTFYFCPQCRKKLGRIPNTYPDRLIDCSHCGFHFYIGPSVTNAVILENSKGEILLVKRKFNPKKGYWDLPGGFVDMRETIEESLSREIKEELHIGISNFKFICSTTDRYKYKNINYYTLCFIFSARMESDDLKPGDDVSAVQFFPKNKIPYPRIAFNGLIKAIKKYLLPLHYP